MFIASILILLVYETVAQHPTSHYSPNVGSVLFSSSDLKRKKWSKTEIALLQARQYFQTLLPVAQTSEPASDHYVNNLLTYLKDAYSAIRTETNDPQLDSILTAAFSDVVGGYLKGWVLPITKYAFYGGSVNFNEASKVYEFYDHLKNYMETDGTDWAAPCGSELNSVVINIAAPPRITSTRSTQENPCEQLAYFENTAAGLNIPIPYINWCSQSSTMFVPLKNQTLYPLTTSTSSNPLFHYYDVALRCIRSNTNFSAPPRVFKERFQSWLYNEVLPHLQDENLYIALGSVLSLMNTTTLTCETPCGGKRVHVVGIPIDLDCKKMIVVYALLVIEILWCFSALVCVICYNRKRAKKKDVAKNDVGKQFPPETSRHVKIIRRQRDRNFDDTDSTFDSIDERRSRRTIDIYTMMNTNNNTIMRQSPNRQSPRKVPPTAKCRSPFKPLESTITKTILHSSKQSTYGSISHKTNEPNQHRSENDKNAPIDLFVRHKHGIQNIDEKKSRMNHEKNVCALFLDDIQSNPYKSHLSSVTQVNTRKTHFEIDVENDTDDETNTDTENTSKRPSIARLMLSKEAELLTQEVFNCEGLYVYPPSDTTLSTTQCTYRCLASKKSSDGVCFYKTNEQKTSTVMKLRDRNYYEYAPESKNMKLLPQRPCYKPLLRPALDTCTPRHVQLVPANMSLHENLIKSPDMLTPPCNPNSVDGSFADHNISNTTYVKTDEDNETYDDNAHIICYKVRQILLENALDDQRNQGRHSERSASYQTHSRPNSSKQSKIPQPMKRKIVDDSVVGLKKTSADSSKLNITL